jgi:hypothetical protein
MDHSALEGKGDEALSDFGFKFNLRRYTKDPAHAAAATTTSTSGDLRERRAAVRDDILRRHMVGWCKLKPVLKAPGFGFTSQRFIDKLKYDKLLPICLHSVSTFAPTTWKPRRRCTP